MEPGTSDRWELRGRLLAVKLRALVGDHLATKINTAPSGFRSGAGLRVGESAWVLIDGEAATSLGPALAWAIRHGATSLDLIAETATGLLARRAAGFDFPISVWFAHDRTLLPVVAEPLNTPVDPLPAHLAMIPMIEEAGATAVVEHGVVAGEVRGLEVCRVVDQPTLGRLVEPGDADLAAAAAGSALRRAERESHAGVLLEVGVGPNDREAFQLLHGDMPTVDALATVVESVRAHRSLDAPLHPLNRMAHERFLRWQLAQDPASVGMVELGAIQPPVARPSMKLTAPCVALGRDVDDLPYTFVMSSGVDLDLLPFVVDAAELACRMHAASDVVTVVLRTSDLVSITRDIAASAHRPVEFVTL